MGNQKLVNRRKGCSAKGKEELSQWSWNRQSVWPNDLTWDFMDNRREDRRERRKMNGLEGSHQHEWRGQGQWERILDSQDQKGTAKSWNELNWKTHVERGKRLANEKQRATAREMEPLTKRRFRTQAIKGQGKGLAHVIRGVNQIQLGGRLWGCGAGEKLTGVECWVWVLDVGWEFGKDIKPCCVGFRVMGSQLGVPTKKRQKLISELEPLTTPSTTRNSFFSKAAWPYSART